MNCETFRERLARDPASIDEESDRHAEGCAACRAYLGRFRRADELIHRALRFDVDSIERRSTGVAVTSAGGSGWVTWMSALAAGLLVGVTFWSYLGGEADLTPEALANAVVDHWYHEPESWTTSDDRVSPAHLAGVLDGEAAVDPAALAMVSYARTCRVGGDRVPHLVVQGSAGPFMVLLMRGRVLQSPVPLELPEEGLSGRIMPAGAGSIAVLGTGRQAEMDRIEEILVAAVDWTI